MDKHYLHSFYKSYNSLCHDSEFDIELFVLFHHWFGREGISFNFCDVVNWWHVFKQKMLDDFENQSFYAFHLRVPFNWRTPCGYLIPFTLQLISTYCSLLCCIFSMSFLIGSACILIAFAKDMENDLNAINESVKTGNRIKLTKSVAVLIQFDADTKRYDCVFRDERSRTMFTEHCLVNILSTSESRGVNRKNNSIY